MLEQELKNIWNNSSQTAEISIQTKQLIGELDTKVNRAQKKIRIRDNTEISASIFGMLLFGYLLYEIPFPITKIACVLAIFWFAFIILKFRKSKIETTQSNLHESLTEQLKQQKTMFSQQANLLSSALYWYSIPPFIMNFIFIIGLGTPSDYNWSNSLAESVLPLTVNLKIGTLIGLAFFYVFSFWVHKNALTKDVKPVLESIKTMQQQLKNEETDE